MNTPLAKFESAMRDLPLVAIGQGASDRAGVRAGR